MDAKIRIRSVSKKTKPEGDCKLLKLKFGSLNKLAVSTLHKLQCAVKAR